MKGTEAKRIRERLELSQAALAKLLGVHRVTLAKWEAGMLEIPTLARLALRLCGDAAANLEVKK